MGLLTFPDADFYCIIAAHPVSMRIIVHTSDMPLFAHGITVYRIGEALQKAGVSRATYFRWVRENRIPDVKYRDRNGRRVFTTNEMAELVGIANRLVDATPADLGQLALGLRI